MKTIKKKTLLILGVGLVAVSVIGATIAVSRDRSKFNNSFKLSEYRTIYTETFDAPTNWMTCQTIDKTITVANELGSSGPVAVRIKLEEQWLASDGITELPLISASSGLTMAQIDFTANSGWTKQGDYYYYDTNLSEGATTTSLITGVTLNCDANLSTAEAGSDDAYAGGTYHLKITAQAIDAENVNHWGVLAKIVEGFSNPDNNINFTERATVADGNGNGVNRYTEKGRDVYYFRGEVDNNNVVWANKCWKIIRTTYTGGTKMIYNGTPSNIVLNGETTKQCLATNNDTRITMMVDGASKSGFPFNDFRDSPASVGYMYGDRVESKYIHDGVTVFTFSNDVSRDGDTYTLDTSSGQSIVGTWGDKRAEAATRYHYFCIDGATSCDGTKIGYIYHYYNVNGSAISYLDISGYDDIEDAKKAMFTNTNDSNAKKLVESWFEQQNLDGHISGSKNYEDELEDAIFCNDRSYYSGALKGKDSDASPIKYTDYSYYGAYGRNMIKNASGNYAPSLDCPNQNDAFTKIDSVNGNAKLGHKVGLVTADEITMAGVGYSGYDTTSYLYGGRPTWSASPAYSTANTASSLELYWYDKLGNFNTLQGYGFRPVVSLKPGTEVVSGTGAKTDPFIVAP